MIDRKELIKSFGAKVRELREALKMSQDFLAVKIGVSRATVNRIENGHHCPDAAALFNLSEALKVPIEDFRPKKKKSHPNRA